MIISINGIPGSGKNVRATKIALKHFKQSNTIIKKVISQSFIKDIIENLRIT